jgi:hypothetical protein
MTEAAWVAISAVASALVAIATGFLARYTYDLAKETRAGLELEREARKSEERRHMDGFMPRIALTVKNETLELFGQGIKQRFVALYAQNIGPGFAQNIRIEHQNIAQEKRLWLGQMPIALEPGAELLLGANDVASALTFQSYKITYEDAFGRKFQSKIGDIVPGARYEWLRCF